VAAAPLRAEAKAPAFSPGGSSLPNSAKAERKVPAKAVPKAALDGASGDQGDAHELSAKQPPWNAQPKAEAAAAGGAAAKAPSGSVAKAGPPLAAPAPQAAGANHVHAHAAAQAKPTPRADATAAAARAQASNVASPGAAAAAEATGAANPYQAAAAANAAPGGATAAAAAAAASRAAAAARAAELADLFFPPPHPSSKPLSPPPPAQPPQLSGRRASTLAALMQKDEQLLKATLKVSAQLKVDELEYNPRTGAMGRKSLSPSLPSSPRGSRSRSISPRGFDRLSGERLEDAAARIQAFAVKVGRYASGSSARPSFSL
jgi:hypothetical protein